MVKNISAEDAFRMIKENLPHSYLIDVRTDFELNTVGKPDLSFLGKEVFFVDILGFEQSKLENEFIAALNSKLSSKINEEEKKTGKFFFICKSGGRSLTASYIAEKFGYENCFNIEGGFEGKKSQSSGENTGKNYTGWKEANLPWN